MKQISVLSILGIATLLVLACNSDTSSSKSVEASEPAPVGVTTVFDDYVGAATASIEERSYQADVIVRARLASATDGILNFNAVTWMKGTGPSSFSVAAKTEGRDTQWDDQDGILFLKLLPDEMADFEFVDTTDMSFYDNRPYILPDDPPFPIPTYTGSLPEGYTVNSRNPVWLPVRPERENVSGVSGASAQSQSESDSDVIADYGSDGVAQTVTLSTIQNAINWITGGPGSNLAYSDSGTTTAAQQSGQAFTDEEFDRCVVIVIKTIRRERDWSAYPGLPERDWRFTEQLDSGLPKGTRALRWETAGDGGGLLPGNQRYHEFRISGRDAHLFESTLIDSDNNSRTGYNQYVLTLRPLPAGEYELYDHVLPYYYKPCNYQPEIDYSVATIVVTAPDRTVHEAFFDPATTTDGVGYGTSTGVLEPAAFDGGGITTLTWRNGKVRIVTNPAGALANTNLDFIALNGSVALSLNPDVATSTGAALAWDVSPAPWAAGDQLMLRVTSDLPPPIFDAQLTVGSLRGCLKSSGAR